MIKIYIEKFEVKIVAFEISDRAEFREFLMTQGDTLPPVDIQFLDSINDPLDLTGYQVDFFFKKNDVSQVLNEGHNSCSIIDASKGMARYEWGNGDTDLVGVHFGEFQLKKSGRVQTINKRLRFKIREQIEGVSGC